MGALEIRRASENLKPIGSFRMPELDTGASKAFTAQANAAKAAADAARVVGSATIHGIMDRGRIVSRTLGHLGEIAMDVFNRENERVADEKFVEKSGWWDLEMNGDGTAEHPGRFNQPVDDVKEWLKGIKDANREADERIMKDMSAAQREIYRRKIARTELSWQGRIGQHAAKVTLGNQVAKAKEASDVCLYKAAESFTGGNPIERDAAIMEAFEAYGHFLDAQAIPKEQQEVAMRPYAVQLISSGLDARIRNLRAQTANCDDAGAVSADWKDQIKAWEEAGFVPDNAQLKAYIGKDGLTEAETTMLRDKLEEAHVKAVRQAEYLYNRKRSELAISYNDKEFELGKVDKSTWVDTYRQWGDDKNLNHYLPEFAKRYRERAKSLVDVELMNTALGVDTPDGKPRRIWTEEKGKDGKKTASCLYPPGSLQYERAKEIQRKADDLLEKKRERDRSDYVDAFFKAISTYAYDRSPAGFYDQAIVALKNGHIDGSDYRKLVKTFETHWLKGDENGYSHRHETARKMLDAAKKTFGEGFVAQFSEDKTGQHGEFVVDPKAARADVEYKRGGRWYWPLGGIIPSYIPAEKQTIGADDMKDVMDNMLMLSRYDGMQVDFDAYGNKLKDGETRTLDAAHDFELRCQRLMDRKAVLSAKDELLRDGTYIKSVRDAFLARQRALGGTN